MKRLLPIIIIFLFAINLTADKQGNQKRNRGESFFNLRNSNTVGFGNIWLSLGAVGHVWDDDQVTLDTTQKNNRKWISNVRAFPEIRIEGGLLNFLSASVESRLLSYGFNPGYVSCGLKLTTTDNLDLRLNGFALEFTFLHQFIESSPTLGGYEGFMPEGFVVKGNSIEVMFLYELDLLARFSRIPVRFIINLGSRIPLRKDRLECFQILGNTGLIYSRYGFDFYTLFSIEAFDNLSGPLIINEPINKNIAVYFSENPMYITMGGNIRYDNGCVLNVSIPLLVSKNRESRMRVEDLVELHRNSNPWIFRDEKKRGIKDPFDPWFVKWKIAGSVTFPLRFKMTSAELMRNYLMLKNRKEQRRINIDQKIGAEEENRLQKIKKRKEEIMNPK
jgi:hypothetical protein